MSRQPGDEWIEIREVPGEPEHDTERLGMPLRSLTEQLGGYVGTMKHPRTGTTYEIDLRDFEGHHPDTTRVAIGFCYVDPALVGTKRGTGHDDR